MPTEMETEKITYLENLTGDELTELEEAKIIGRQIIDGIEWALKMAHGEVSRPKQSLDEFLDGLEKEIADGIEYDQ